MTFTYDGDPSAGVVEEIRFHIGDTVEASAFLTDEEIEFLVTSWTPICGDDRLMIASYAAESIAGKLASEVSVSGDGVSVDTSGLQQKFLDLAASLRARARAARGRGVPDFGGVYAGETQLPGVAPFSFGVGFEDNPRAGSQSLGGSLSTAAEDPLVS